MRALTSAPRSAAVPWNSMEGTASRAAEAAACGAGAASDGWSRRALAWRGARAARAGAASGIGGVSPSVPTSAAEPLKLSGCANGRPMVAAASSSSFRRTAAAGMPSTAVVSSVKSSVPPCTASLSMATCHAGAAAAAAPAPAPAPLARDAGGCDDSESNRASAFAVPALAAPDSGALAAPGVTSRLNCPSAWRRSARCGPFSSTAARCTLRSSGRTSPSCTFSASKASASAPCPSTDFRPLTVSVPPTRSDGWGVCSKPRRRSASTVAACSLMGRPGGM